MGPVGGGMVASLRTSNHGWKYSILAITIGAICLLSVALLGGDGEIVEEGTEGPRSALFKRHSAQFERVVAKEEIEIEEVAKENPDSRHYYNGRFNFTAKGAALFSWPSTSVSANIE